MGFSFEKLLIYVNFNINFFIVKKSNQLKYLLMKISKIKYFVEK